MIDNTNNSIITQWYTDANGNPISVKTEQKTQASVGNGLVQLEGIPDEMEEVRIEDKDGVIFSRVDNLDEVYDNEHAFFLMNDGRVKFNPIQDGQELNFKYYSKGVTLLSVSRLYYKDSYDNVVKILEYLIKKGFDALKTLELFGGAKEVIERLEKDLTDGTNLATRLENIINIGKPIDDSLKSLVPQAQAIEPKLKADNTEANRIQPILHADNAEANRIDPILKETIRTATDMDDKIKTTGNTSLTINVANWVDCTTGRDKYQYEYVHTMHSIDFVIDARIISVDGHESGQIDNIIKDDSHIIFYTDEKCDVKINLNARQYNGSRPDYSAITADNISEGVNRKYVTTAEKNEIAKVGNKQDKTDNLLQTNDKTISGAINEVNTKSDSKVDKVSGKGLSTNDYTSDEKNSVTLISNKADINYVDTKVATISSGTPLFASSVNGMTDKSKNYVNTTDGYLYTYNGTTFVKSSIMYQSQGIEDESITQTKRTVTGDYALVIGNSDVNFDFINNVAKFSSNGATHRVMYRNKVYTIPSDTSVDLSLDSTTKSAKIYFNTKTNFIKKYSWAGTTGIPEEEILIGAYSLVDGSIPKLFFNGNHIVNGVRAVDVEGGYFEKGISFNATGKSLKIIPQKLIYGEEYYSVDTELNLAYSTSGGYGKTLVFNLMNKTIYIKSDTIFRTYEIILAYWRVGEETCATVNGCFTVDGLVNEIGANYFVNYKPINFDMVNKKMKFNIDANNKCILFYNNGSYDIPTNLNEVDLNIADTSIVKIYFDIKNNVFRALKWNVNPLDGKNILIATIKTSEPYDVKINAQYTINNRQYEGLVDKYIQGDYTLSSFGDCINSWWVYPLGYRYKGMRDNTYIGYTTSKGYSGVASIDNSSGKVTKKHLKRGMIDDHNGVSVMAMSDGKILTAYCGHNEDKYAHIRISKNRESVDEFEDDILIEFPATTTYTQLFYKDSKYHLFVRVSGSEWLWMYTSSSDGKVWSTPKKLLKSGTMQYYLKVSDTTHPNILKLLMYSNPQATDTNIRLGYLNVTTGDILNADYSTVVGNISTDTGISKDSFTIVVPKGSKTLRLLDVAVTSISKTLISYAEFTTNNDIIYKVATYNGTTTAYSNGIVAGQPFYLPSTYVGGVIFLDENTLIVSREENGIWYMEKWVSTDGMNYTKNSEINKTVGGITATRPFKITNADNKFMYSLGEYNNQDYTKFYTDLI